MTRTFLAARLSLLALILFILPSFALGAVIKGSVYNIYLDPLNKAIVSIDTQPTQTIVSKGGTYTFQVPLGSYTLLAVHEENGTTYSAKEKLTVAQEGQYSIDLILIPEIEGDDVVDNSTQEQLAPFEQHTSPIALILTLTLLLFFLLYLFLTKTHFLGDDDHAQKTTAKTEELKPEPPQQQETIEPGDEADKLLSFIKEQGGRATQKDIRKRFPLSEAKVSLIIAELESEGKVKKIKKGRSNIILLN